MSLPSELMRGLESGRVEPDLLAKLERELKTRGADAMARWVHHESNGYGEAATAASLSELFGVAPDSELVRAVIRARVRLGRFQASGRVVSWPHFFVEPLVELQQLAERVGRSGVADIIVELRNAPGSAGPTELAFPRSVFHDVVRSVLIELADTLRRTEHDKAQARG